MQVIRTVPELRDRLRERRGKKRAFVPTMGALHEGHLSLCDHARNAIGPKGDLVASIFVNPAQFGPGEDFEAYPRPLDADLDKCRARGVDLIFAPEADALYRPDRSVAVTENTLSRGLCGASRPGHFDGVCTVVTKLFHLVQPDLAVFGEKDYQQLAVIRRMVRDLDFPVEILGAPIVREDSGLAMSSRNQYLSERERAEAPALHRALAAAAEASTAGEALALARRELDTTSLGRIDYLEAVDPETLEPLPKDSTGPGRLLLAVFFGKTRLIDNGAILTRR